MNRLENPAALITGASSGIGAVFARQLAAQRYDLILVARRQDRLESLATELQRLYPIQAQPLAADLSSPQDLERVEGWIAKLDSLRLLVNNAGFGSTGKFSEADLTQGIQMVQVHIHATMHLCHAALPGMIQRRQGAIINVASLAAMVPLPGSATYSATKAFLVAFSEALQQEVEREGVHVQALCPGFTYTEFHDTPQLDHFQRSQIPRWLWGNAEEVVAESLRLLPRKQVVVIPGRLNRSAAALARSPLTGPLFHWLLRSAVRRRQPE